MDYGMNTGRTGILQSCEWGVNARLLPRDVRDRTRVSQGGHDAR